MLRASELARVVGVGHLVMADHVIPVERHSPPRADGRGKAGAGLVLGGRVQPGRICKARVLDADRARVVVPVAGMPRDVVLPDHLRDLAVVVDDIVRGASTRRVLECLDRGAGAALDVVDHDHVDRIVMRPVGHAVVGRVGRDPRSAWVVGARCSSAVAAQRSGRLSLRGKRYRLAARGGTCGALTERVEDLIRHPLALHGHDRGPPRSEVGAAGVERGEQRGARIDVGEDVARGLRGGVSAERSGLCHP